MSTIIFVVYILLMIIMSILAYVLFIIDKKAAVNKNDRIKEKTLLGVIAFGGAIGGFLGSVLKRHKTNKIYFTISIYLGLILQISTLIILFILI